MKRIILLLSLTIITGLCRADNPEYMKSKEYLDLRNAMNHAFNDGDSARFFPAIKALEDYLQSQNDVHGYYTQRCNEIVFQLNQQRIYEAYKLAQQLTKELRENKIDKEMFMGVNMMGHINRYCGNDKEAVRNWYEVIRLMKEEGYESSMPPIYLNIVGVVIDKDPQEADSLLTVAKEIAKKYSPERVFDIETRQTVSDYSRGDYDQFLKGYQAYKEGEKKGYTSVHGRSLEVRYLAYQGKTDEAVEMAKKELGDEGADEIPLIYEKAGRWKEAYYALKEAEAKSDSIDNVVIANSMQGISEQIKLFETERAVYRERMYAVIAVFLLLLLLIVALVYIVHTRRKHLIEMQRAYRRAMESEKMKSAFIQNISHEIRTPLNIISGFAQVIANPELTETIEERQRIAEMMEKNAHHVTALIDEIIGLSLIESTEKMRRDDTMLINKAMREALKRYEKVVNPDIKLLFETSLPDEFTLKTNAGMLARIINSLLENAAKYTKEGHIALRSDRKGNMLTFTVEDTGSGIPAEEAEHIFERFVKLDSFKEGIGLGLPLSRKLAEQLDGTVVLDTSYTNGARFLVRIPIPS